jgi:hypothetical protein
MDTTIDSDAEAEGARQFGSFDKAVKFIEHHGPLGAAFLKSQLMWKGPTEEV